MDVAQKVMSDDPTIRFLPTVPTPAVCATTPESSECSNKWWAMEVAGVWHQTSWGPSTSAQYTFNAGAFELYGATTSAGARATAVFDNKISVLVDFGSTDGKDHTGQLLLNQTGLDDGPHTLTLSYHPNASPTDGSRRYMHIEYFNVVNKPNGATSSPVEVDGAADPVPVGGGSEVGTTSQSQPGHTTTTGYPQMTGNASGVSTSGSSDGARGPKLSIVIPVVIISTLLLVAMAHLAFRLWRRRRRQRKEGKFVKLSSSQQTSELESVRMSSRYSDGDPRPLQRVVSGTSSAGWVSWHSEPLPPYEPPDSPVDYSKVVV